MSLGRQGENLAALHLRRKKYRIIERNYRTKLGEIDIIASTGKTLVFCEVKTRLSQEYGHPLESITPQKQRTIKKVAELYLASNLDLRQFDSVRFDVITLLQEGNSQKLEHIENAF